MIDDPQKKLHAFGQKLRELRKSKGLTIEKLANIADLERIAVSRIELGKTNPKLITILSLSEALEVSPKDFF